MVPFIDTHCHLDLFKGIRELVSAENASGIKTITVTNAPFLWEPNNSLFVNCDNIRVALGLHPELAGTRSREIATFKQYCTEAKYIGEIGLDGSAAHKASWETQLFVFKGILQAIRGLDKKILTIHSRGAATEVINLLKSELKGNNHKVILHWFTGSMPELEAAIRLGCYFSVNHKMVTTERGRKTVSAIPAAQILTETDAPFTFDTRVTSRSASLAVTVTELARVWGIDFVEAKLNVYTNFKRLLG